MPTPCESWPLRFASTRLSATVFASCGVLPAAWMIVATVARRCAAVSFLLMFPFRSHHRADLPRHEFVLAVAMLFALAVLTGRRGEHEAEDALAHLLDRGLAVDDLAAVDVHVLLLPLPQHRVRRELERWRGRAAVGGAASGGEADHVGAAGHLAGGTHRVVAGRVHVDEAVRGHRLRVFVDGAQVGRAAL